MIIRAAIEKDADGIAEAHVKSWRETYQGIVSQQFLDELSKDERLKMWKQMLSAPQPGAAVFVAEEKGKIIGFASFGKERTGELEADSELYAIYLLKEYKGKKVGTMLFKRGAEALLANGFSSLVVWVLNDNPSRLFYESFKPVKLTEQMINIGGNEYKETAYYWDNLQDLYLKLTSSEE
ncbi:GNAT family N-acetyltransferase [Bacillus sp. V3-13]|uniref:GNAT family N-acetyltransferase n=1 Tax=Bacillus sp. V3-13 TaxID=2053728 RepID=UPI000C781586|nr:GNAT family N-acetyltransferase [Bacillus sp. V3-13]PLR75192.1 GNAT family N-acetyltransferase [Bacillus sp. V3-13]